MIKNYIKKPIELKEPEKSTIDFILNYSKALHVNLKCKVQTSTILN